MMDSFKDSIDTTLATKAEQVATAASQSADLIKKCKQFTLYCFYSHSLEQVGSLRCWRCSCTGKGWGRKIKKIET